MRACLYLGEYRDLSAAKKEEGGKSPPPPTRRRHGQHFRDFTAARHNYPFARASGKVPSKFHARVYPRVPPCPTSILTLSAIFLIASGRRAIRSRDKTVPRAERAPRPRPPRARARARRSISSHPFLDYAIIYDSRLSWKLRVKDAGVYGTNCY